MFLFYLLQIREGVDQQEGSERPHYQTFLILDVMQVNEPSLSQYLRECVHIALIIFLSIIFLYLAALHFSEHAGRLQATTSAGELLFRVNFPRREEPQQSR